jgi:hypothetical protein
MGTPAHDTVKRLVDHFDQNHSGFLSPDCKEEQLRAAFLNHFFTALGWDADNKQSPSEFSAMPADVLRQVHEQFLGKVIRLTAGHQAKVEEKPEVSRAGGVYNAPPYIVDYIVKNTVGKLLEGGTPRI